MKFTNRDGELVIVGATSASMVFAAQLLAYGIHPIIIDERKGLTDLSDKVTLDRKSIDILRKFGFLESLLNYGYECEGLTIQSEGEMLKRFDFGANVHTSVHTSFLHVGQHAIDKALLQYLGSQACPVYWDSKITDFSQTDSDVMIMMRQDELSFKIKAQWVILSTYSNPELSKSLILEHKSWSFNRPFFQSEIRTDVEVDKDIHLILSKKGFTLAKPFANKNSYQLLSTLKTEGATVRYAHTTLASSYVIQRCILLGKPAYTSFDIVRSSVNRQFEDACNLSWKLALIILDKADKSLLATYEQERRPLAARASNQTQWILRLLSYSGRIFSQARLQIIIKTFAKQLNVEGNYRRSSLSLHHSLSANIIAGDWLPNLTIYDENKGVETSLHEWTEQNGFVLLLLGNLSSHLRFSIGQTIKQKYNRYMHLYYLPYTSKNNHIFKAFEINGDQHRMILIRPDGYIAFINDALNASLVDTYMAELMRWKY